MFWDFPQPIAAACVFLTNNYGLVTNFHYEKELFQYPFTRTLLDLWHIQPRAYNIYNKGKTCI